MNRFMYKMFKNKLMVLFSLIIFLGVTNMQTSKAEEAKAKPCDAKEFRAFDFWLGEWTVSTPKQKTPTATSSITLANDGCSIHERYETKGGFTGNSINFYDKKNKKWHQTWVDNQGGALYLNGELTDGAMVLSDAANRITWTLLANGQVNQVWETTADEGKSWKKVFDGFYTKK